MRVLVLFGSKRGATEGIARTVAQELREMGLEASAMAPGDVTTLVPYDAVIVGGALYARHWPLRLRWYVRRHAEELRKVPVYFFSSGPLDDSAQRAEIPPTRSVLRLMERVGARGHITFGGRLAPDAQGFPAKAMARDHAGDWRDIEHIRAWSFEVGQALSAQPPAHPGSEPASPQA